MSDRLLPSDEGPATKAIAYTFDFNRRYGALAGTINRYGIDIVPDDWVPWLIYEYGLEDIVGYVRTLRQVLAEGPLWQARRGTPSGIEIGIGWVGSTGEVAPPDGRHSWWKFQVAFDKPVDDEYQIRQLVGIINLSKASEDELFRIYSKDRDYRPVRMDHHRFDTGGQFDGYSGRRLWKGGPLVSFGWARTYRVDLDIASIPSVEVEESIVRALFDGGFRMDRRRYGGRPERIATSTVEVDSSGALLDRTDYWPSFWPSGSYAPGADSSAIVTPLEVS